MSHSPPHMLTSSEPGGMTTFASYQLKAQCGGSSSLLLTLSSTVLISPSSSSAVLLCSSSSKSTVRTALRDLGCAHCHERPLKLTAYDQPEQSLEAIRVCSFGTDHCLSSWPVASNNVFYIRVILQRVDHVGRKVNSVISRSEDWTSLIPTLAFQGQPVEQGSFRSTSPWYGVRPLSSAAN